MGWSQVTCGIWTNLFFIFVSLDKLGVWCLKVGCTMNWTSRWCFWHNLILSVSGAWWWPLLICCFLFLLKFRQKQEKQYPVALILAPTRELASQIHDEARKVCQLLVSSDFIWFGRFQLKSLNAAKSDISLVFFMMYGVKVL